MRKIILDILKSDLVIAILRYEGYSCSREGSVVENQELTQIFIKYMHDIVLKISFLDLNNSPNLSPSHWKLWKEMLKTKECAIIYQIFRHVVDGHEKTHFL